MLVFNCSGRHLTGADRRSVRRAYRRKQRKHAARLRSSLGPLEGAQQAREARRREERELVQTMGDQVYGAMISTVHFGPHRGNVLFDFAGWSVSPVGRFPTVRI